MDIGQRQAPNPPLPEVRHDLAALLCDPPKTFVQLNMQERELLFNNLEEFSLPQIERFNIPADQLNERLKEHLPETGSFGSRIVWAIGQTSVAFTLIVFAIGALAGGPVTFAMKCLGTFASGGLFWGFLSRQNALVQNTRFKAIKDYAVTLAVPQIRLKDVVRRMAGEKAEAQSRLALEQIQQLTAQVGQQTTKAKGLKKQLSDLQRTIKKLKQQTTVYQQAVHRQKQKTLEAGKEHAQTKVELAQELANLSLQKQTAETQIKQLQGELVSQKQIITNQAKNLKQSVEEAENRDEQFAAELQQKNRQLQQVHDELERIRPELENIKQIKTGVLESLKEKEAECKRVRQEKEDLEASHTVIQQELLNLRTVEKEHSQLLSEF